MDRGYKNKCRLLVASHLGKRKLERKWKDNIKVYI
jgi:hypothetical protein